MKLFKVEQLGNACLDEFQSMICAAENESLARVTSPVGFDHPVDDQDSFHFWGCGLDELKITYIGEAAEGIQQGVICADFNAG